MSRRTAASFSNTGTLTINAGDSLKAAKADANQRHHAFRRNIHSRRQPGSDNSGISVTNELITLTLSGGTI